MLLCAYLLILSFHIIYSDDKLGQRKSEEDMFNYESRSPSLSVGNMGDICERGEGARSLETRLVIWTPEGKKNIIWASGE